MGVFMTSIQKIVIAVTVSCGIVTVAQSALKFNVTS